MAITLIKSYKDAETYFSKSRSKDKGRPVASWGRMHKVGDNYEVHIGKDIIGKYTPDNKFVFDMDVSTITRWSTTLVGAMHRALPFNLLRVSTGRYRIEHEGKIPMKQYSWGEYPDWKQIKGKSPEFFGGITFDLATGDCLNRQRDLLDTVDTDARKEWLTCLRKFKRGMKVRAKMGVFDSFITEVTANRNNRQRPDWNSTEWQSKLANSIKTGDFSPELLRGMVQTAHTKSWRSEVTPKSVVEAVDSVCNTYSIQLRRSFGVFNQGE